MATIRALIVDDSKSARVVLSRVLEKLEMSVVTTESAESALHYLRDHRPDVIFMDHVMSGMDGLQAVQAIKSDPHTASIPIMMYTSQDGELYAGEARALGAAGVLPKLMAPADISKVLHELEILPESGIAQGAEAGAPAAIAAEAQPSAPAAPGALAASDSPLTGTTVREIVEPLLRDQGADLRRFVVASLESFSARVVSDVHAAVEAAATRAAAAVATAAPPSAPAPAASPVAAPVHRPLVWIVAAAAALIAAIVAGVLAWQQYRELRPLRDRVDVQARALAAAEGALASLRAAQPVAAAAERRYAPYGQVVLSGERLAALGTLLADLEQHNFTGTVVVTTAAGEFCLTGNPTEGYAPAPGEMPANRCDFVGNPFEETLRPADREPAALAALIAATYERTHGAIEVTVAHAARGQPGSGYPQAADVSAAQWNAAAASHNYVEFRPEPRRRAP